MSAPERRQYHRARLRLRVARLEGLPPPADPEDLWTRNVSAGGMYLQAPFAEEPLVDADVVFELIVPPGEGYSVLPGRIRGTGKVVRTVRLEGDQTGLAVQFTRPLALVF